LPAIRGAERVNQAICDGEMLVGRGGGFYQQSVSVANIIIAIRICGNFKGGGDIF